MSAGLSIAEVATQVGRSEQTVRRWIASGALPATDLRGGSVYARWEVDPEDLRRFLDSRRNTP